MPTEEEDERLDLAMSAVDEALDSDELADRLQGATVMALMDIADSLDVLSQYVELKGKSEARRAPRPRRSAKKEEKDDGEEE